MKINRTTALTFLAPGILLTGSVLAQQTSAAAAAANPDPSILKSEKDKSSYAIGISIGKSLQRDGIDADLAILLRGVNDTLAGGKPPLTDDEAKAALTTLQAESRAKQEAKLKTEADENTKEGEAFLAANKSKAGVKTLASGVQYKVETEGDGPKPISADTVECNYRGTLINGKEFDSSYKRGQSASFPVGGVIKGWTEVLQLMPVGSKYQVFIPGELAYGPHPPAGADIGPNATLLFQIELLSIKGKAALPAVKPTKPQGRQQAMQAEQQAVVEQAADSNCSLPPLSVDSQNTESFANDSHQYNPYSSADNDKAGLHHESKKDGENGHWVTREFSVGCGGSNEMYQSSYVTASVVDSRGIPACQTGPMGNFLEIENTSSKFPAYYGLSGVLNLRLLPNEQSMINVSPYFNKNKPPITFTQSVNLKYWLTDSPDPQSSLRCKTTAEYQQYQQGKVLQASVPFETKGATCAAVVQQQLYDTGSGTHYIYGWSYNQSTADLAISQARKQADIRRAGAELDPSTTQPDVVLQSMCGQLHGALAVQRKGDEFSPDTYWRVYGLAFGPSESEAKSESLDKCFNGNQQTRIDCFALGSW